MIKYGELHQALVLFTNEDIHEDIPIDYYRRVIKACFRANNKGLNWDIHQAASILTYLAFNDGHIQPNQLNANGLKILDWAESFLQQIDMGVNKEVAHALRST